MQPKFEPELASLGAGLGLAVLDWGLLLAGPQRVAAGPMLAALAIPLFAALLGAALWRLAAMVVRLLAALEKAELSRMLLEARLMVAGVLAIPPVLYVSYRLFQGTGISHRWYAPYGPYLVAPFLLGFMLLGVALCARVLPLARRSLLGRILVAVLLLLAAGLLAVADRRLYPTQYAYLHAVLLCGCGAGLLGTVWLIIPTAGTPKKWRWVGPALLGASLPAFLVAASFSLHGQREMQLFAERTQASGRLAALFRQLLDRDSDHYSTVFGEHDCDNGNPAIHPFAVDVPGNGIDEDCDGKDAAPPPPPKPTAAPGVPEYRRIVATFQQRQAVRELLRRTAGYNVILVVIDALRADQLLPTAENRQNHPRLVRLVQESRAFVRAFSTGAGTDIGMATVFTGQLDPFDNRHRSLFRAYQQAGFRTFGIFQREVERWVGRQFAIDGLGGRKIIVNDPGRRDVGIQPTSRQVTEEALRFLRRQGDDGSRFFLWLHYFDVHEHHQIDPARLPEPERFRAPRGRAFYRSLVRYVDEEFGKFLDELKSSGLGERTILALVGDHGEALGENPRLPANHGDVLFNPLVHVPMLLRVPGLAAGEVRLAVSLADLCPTLLGLSGIPLTERTYGVDLLPYLTGAPPQELLGFIRPVVMYETQQRALLLWPWKFIAWQNSGRVELYQLEQDFAEARNLADEQVGRAREMAQQLATYPLITIDRLAHRR